MAKTPDTNDDLSIAAGPAARPTGKNRTERSKGGAFASQKKIGPDDRSSEQDGLQVKHAAPGPDRPAGGTKE